MLLHGYVPDLGSGYGTVGGGQAGRGQLPSVASGKWEAKAEGGGRAGQPGRGAEQSRAEQALPVIH